MLEQMKFDIVVSSDGTASLQQDNVVVNGSICTMACQLLLLTIVIVCVVSVEL